MVCGTAPLRNGLETTFGSATPSPLLCDLWAPCRRINSEDQRLGSGDVFGGPAFGPALFVHAASPAPRERRARASRERCSSEIGGAASTSSRMRRSTPATCLARAP